MALLAFSTANPSQSYRDYPTALCHSHYIIYYA